MPLTPAVLSGKAGSAYRKAGARLVNRLLRKPGTSHPINAQVLTPSSLCLLSYLWATDFVTLEEDSVSPFFR